uniref:Serine/threonine-protein phosphatase PGAM5, mitochondrial n=1 Tax=Eptatretus burgeri TaxID=7764 RepID=A0A8C4RCM2_EPTBU
EEEETLTTRTTFLQQAKLTAMRLANLGFHYDAIIHSSMKRAVETAQIIQTKIPGPELQSSDLLREGMPYRPDPLNHWRPEMKYFTDGARIEAAFRECFHRAEDHQNGDTYVIIVCHANVIRYFVCRALQFPPQGWLRMSLNHGSITWISIRPNGRVSLKALGDSGFMPPDLLTH